MLSLISIALSLPPPILLTPIIIPRLASHHSIDEQTEEKQDSFGPQWIESHRREDGSFVMGYYLPNTNYIDSLKYNKGLDQLELYFDYRITVIDDGVKIASGTNLQLDFYNSPYLNSFNDCSKSISCAAEMSTWNASEDMIRKEKDLSFEEQEDLLKDTFSESNCKIKIFPVESMITYRFRYEPLKPTIHIEETCIVSTDYLLYGLNGISILGSFSALLLLIFSVYKLYSNAKNKW